MEQKILHDMYSMQFTTIQRIVCVFPLSLHTLYNLASSSIISVDCKLPFFRLIRLFSLSTDRDNKGDENKLTSAATFPASLLSPLSVLTAGARGGGVDSADISTG